MKFVKEANVRKNMSQILYFEDFITTCKHYSSKAINIDFQDDANFVIFMVFICVSLSFAFQFFSLNINEYENTENCISCSDPHKA